MLVKKANSMLRTLLSSSMISTLRGLFEGARRLATTAAPPFGLRVLGDDCLMQIGSVHFAGILSAKFVSHHLHRSQLLPKIYARSLPVYFPRKKIVLAFGRSVNQVKDKWVCRAIYGQGTNA